MKKFFFQLIAVAALALFVRAAYLVLTAPPDPAFGAANHDAAVAQLDHMFRQAAYSIVWAIQLGYLAWVGRKWSDERAGAGQSARGSS
jgi:hypothetical protein